MTTAPQQTESQGSVFLREGEIYRPEFSPETALPYEMAITNWVASEPKYEPGLGNRIKTIVEFDDGSRFVFQKFVPEHQRYGVSVDFAPPLGTRVKGHNTYLQRKLAEGGVHSRLIGTNQARNFSLLHDAQAMLTILDYDDRLQMNDPTCHPGESVIIGYSMGEMKALAVEGLSGAFERNIHFMKGIDPCIAEKVQYHYRKIPKLVPYLGKEIFEVSRMFVRDARRNSPAHAAALGKNLISTMGFGIKYPLNTLDKWNTIATGEAGTFAKNIPDEAVMIIHFFNQSELNNQEIFAQQLAGKTNTRLLYEDGYHLSGADTEVLQAFVEQIQYGLHLVEDGASPTEIADALAVPIMPVRKHELLSAIFAHLHCHKAA